MRTVTKSKRRQFELDLHAIISDGVNGGVDVTHVRDARKATQPKVYVQAWGPDKVTYVRDEAGPVVDSGGNHKMNGECEFALWVDVKIAQADTHDRGTLLEEADLRAEIVEDALKYGAALEDFQNSRLRIRYDEALPTETWIALDESDNTATVWIKGVIKYEQQDL